MTDTKLTELKTINGINGDSPRNYEYFTDEMAAKYGITDPEEIQGMRDALYQIDNEIPTRDYCFFFLASDKSNSLNRI